MAGPKKAKGFEVNRFFADDGVYVGLEWIFKLPSFLAERKLGGVSLGTAFQPYLLADVAYGVTHPFVAGEESSIAELADIGLGLKINYSSSWRANLSYAQPVLDNVTGLDEQKSGITYFNLQYSF